MLAKRVQDLVGKSSLQQMYMMRAKEDPFDPESNPQGFVNLALAENTLPCVDMLLPALQAMHLQAPDLKYAPNVGLLRLRQALAWLCSLSFGYEPDPQDLVLANGVTSLNNLLSFCLCDQGDGILLGAPLYPGFALDFEMCSKATLLPVPERDTEGQPLCVEDLEQAYRDAVDAGVRPRVLCVCSPTNPTGRVFSRDALQSVVEWGLEKEDMHVIVDEIYAWTTFEGETFTSVHTLPVVPNERLHTTHGLAKDFGLSGVKKGWLHTKHEDLKSVLRQLTRFSQSSTLSQLAVATLLEDRQVPEKYLQSVSSQLAGARDFALSKLDSIGVSARPSQAGLFVWVDLRPQLQEVQERRGLSSVDQAQSLLLETMIEEEKLIMLSSSACRSPEPGFFRMSIAYREYQGLVTEAVARLRRALEKLRAPGQ